MADTYHSGPLGSGRAGESILSGSDARITLYWNLSYIGVSSGTTKLETKDSKSLHVLKLM